jgi:hypothetical protein
MGDSKGRFPPERQRRLDQAFHEIERLCRGRAGRVSDWCDALLVEVDPAEIERVRWPLIFMSQARATPGSLLSQRSPIRRKQPRVARGDVKHDRAGLEQGHVAVLAGRDLPERVQPPVRRLLHRREGDRAHVVGLADLLERPADAHVAHQPPPAVGGERLNAVMVGRL